MKIFTFAREAGGAEAILPVVKKLKEEGHDVLVAAKDVGIDVFSRNGILVEFKDDHIEEIVLNNGNKLDLILTSAASLPELDMTEKRLWKIGRKMGIPSIAVLDQWQNYARRFSSIGSRDLIYQPDICCVMDSNAAKGMSQEGFPDNKIRITGQPAFDRIVSFPKSFSEESKMKLLESIGASKYLKTVVFVSESLRKHHNYGYDEVSTLKFLLEAMSEENDRINLIIKKHPQNSDEDFADINLPKYQDKINVVLIGNEYPREQIMCLADVIIGMSSVLLVESILMKIPTVSLQINAIEDDKCFPVNVGAIPLVKDEVEGRRIIHSLLENESYRNSWLKKQTLLSNTDEATGKVISEIKNLVKLEKK